MDQCLRVGALIWQGKRWMGGWNYYLNMARVLRCHSSDVRLILFVPEGIDAESRQEAERASGHPTYLLPKPSRLGDAARLLAGHNRRLGRRLKDAKVDLVIEQACFLGRNFPIPIISWIADLQHRVKPEFFSPFQRIVRDVGFKAQLMTRNNIYVSSLSAKSDLYDFVNSPRANVHALPFSVQPNINVLASGVRGVRNKYHLNEGYFIVPNQLWPHKNHVTAIRAMASLMPDLPNCVLALTGTPEDATHPGVAEELLSLAEVGGIERNIRWLGKVSYSDLQHLIAGADALINPSKFEGWSTTVEEAKALGTPLILSDLSVHREQAAGQAKFFPAEDHDALGRLLREVKLPQDSISRRLARAAAKNVEDQRNYAHRIENLFRSSAASR